MKNLIYFGMILFLFSCGPVRFSTKNYSNGTYIGSSQILTRNINSQTVIVPPNNKLDLLLVIDNSNSMLADNQKLAARLANFVSDLQGSAIDWQMCVTVTSTLNVANVPRWGASILWSNYTPSGSTPAWVLRAGTLNLSTIFTNTINAIGAGWSNTDDERGLKAAWWHLYNGDPRYQGNSGCYRNDAALSMIVISDEDERSIGGAATDEYYDGEFRVLEHDDLPTTLISQVQDIFGGNKIFTVNSIITRPDDTACMQSQDGAGSKSHFGRIYAEASQLTGGGIGSICDTDYTGSLNYFKNIIQTSLASVPLECIPFNSEISFTINGTGSPTHVMDVQGMNAVFTPPLTAGTSLGLNYRCPVN